MICYLSLFKTKALSFKIRSPILSFFAAVKSDKFFLIIIETGRKTIKTTVMISGFTLKEAKRNTRKAKTTKLPKEKAS